MKKFCHEVVRRLLVAALLICALGACAMPPLKPWHSFSFNGWSDKWADQADLLEYDYGGKYRMVRGKVASGQSGVGYVNNVNGPMPVGDFLYVRWRLKGSNEIFEDKVDLRDLLPGNMQDHGLTFVIDRQQLYVYLITPLAKHESDRPLLKTTKSRYYVTYEVYPQNTYKK